jgi:hypothetical protein
MWIRLLSFLIIALVLSGVLFAIFAMLRFYLSPKSKEAARPTDAGIRDLILEGQHDEAVEVYQRFTGIDELAARKYVEDLEREIRLSDETYQAVQRILKSDGKAAAIEAYQEQTGAILADALAYVEAIEERKK